MKKTIYISLMALLCGFTAITAKPIQQKVYIFGIAASFNDSIVYITDIQTVDSAWVDDKTHFLLSRQDYAYQMRDHLEKSTQQKLTCATVFSLKENKIQKKYEKARKRYTKEKYNYDVHYLKASDFAFVMQDANVMFIEQPKLTKAERKAQRQERRKKNQRRR